MDPVRNPFAPGAGQRPPELAGRDRELDAFEIVLERVARGRPERSLVLTGLRGVGKTVLLGELRSMAVRAGLGRRQDRGPAGGRPAPAAVGRAAPGDPRPRRAAPRPGPGRRGARRAQGVRAALRAGRGEAARPLAARHRRAGDGRAGPTPATSRSTWSSCSPRSPSWPRTWAPASRSSSTRCRTCARTTSRRCARPATSCPSRGRRWWWSVPGCRTCPRCCRRRSPTPSGCSATSASVSSTAPTPTSRCSPRPSGRTRRSTPTRWTRSTSASGGYPYFVQAYGKAAWDAAPRSPIGADDVEMAAPEAEAELAVGLLRLPVRAGHPGRAGVPAGDGRADRRPGRAGAAPRASPSTWRRKPSSLSPARDSLLKKGLVFSAQRGQIAFTVPHFGRYLLAQA